MRVVVVTFANLTGIPYIETYTDVLKEHNIEYDIITWDRLSKNETENGCRNLYSFKKGVRDDESIVKKIIPILSYTRYVKQILSKEKYDKVIVLTSLIGVLLERYLKKNYTGRYIFDIRDHSYEHIRWYFNKMDYLMKYSALSVISSKGFMNFLPPNSHVVSHNCNFKKVSEHRLNKNNGKIVISFVGGFRYEEECKKFLNIIKNHEKIEFRFYGRGEGEKPLKEFCEQNGFTNVGFFGEYEPQEKEGIIALSDFLFNAYGNESIHVIYAISNKYYEALFYKKPLIVNPGTLMAEMSKGVAFEVDYKNCVAENIIKWYEELDENQFNNITDKYLQLAIDENMKTQESITKAILG